MSRVTTKVTDLESLQRARKELELHLEEKRVTIQLEVNELKRNFLPSRTEVGEASGFSSKAISKMIVKNFIKPKSKIVSKVSIFLGSFLIDKYGKSMQTGIANWISKKNQNLINDQI